MSFTYDARNTPSKLNRSNGVTTNYTYDPVGQLLSIVHARDGTTLQTLSYTSDRAGNRIGQQASSAQPLTTQAATASYDDANRLIQRGSTTLGYDDNGNLTSESGPTGTTTYTWDTRNRLVGVTTSTGQKTEFRYDFAGDLIRQSDSGPTGSVTRSFVLDYLTNVVYQQSSDGDNLSVLTGESIDSHLAAIRSNGQLEFSLADAINSTVGTVDQTGALKGQFFYTAFGETKASGSTYPFQYTGRVPVSQNLYYYRARFYSPTMGRFISEDAIGLENGVNLYMYVGNAPISLNDPLGLQPIGGFPLPSGRGLPPICLDQPKPDPEAKREPKPKVSCTLVDSAVCRYECKATFSDGRVVRFIDYGKKLPNGRCTAPTYENPG